MRAAHLVGERKLITVLFADVVDSTGLAERMDPEDWAAIMNRAFERLSPVIAAYGGTLARLMGDALLAFFGAPLVREDDPLRAVAAARDLLAAAREYSSEVEPVLGRPFEIRVGLNTGWVVVGDVGSNLKFEYTAMGDAVNLAARMQSAARPGTALMTAATYEHVAGEMACVDRGMVAVRGRTAAVRAFKLDPRAVEIECLATELDARTVAVERQSAELEARAVEMERRAAELERGLLDLDSAGRARLAAPVGAITSPFVGRQAEFGELGECFDALALGQGGLLQIVGDASIGENAAARRGAASRQWRRLQWLQGTAPRPRADRVAPFSAFRAIVRAAGSASADAELDFGALRHDGELDEPAVALQLCHLVERMLDRGPLVLVLDDVQWLDPASMRVLRSLARLAAHRALLVCVVGRPEAVLPARFAAGTQLTLAPLSPADSATLVNAMLTRRALFCPACPSGPSPPPRAIPCSPSRSRAPRSSASPHSSGPTPHCSNRRPRSSAAAPHYSVPTDR